jgi:hypothetical protein
MFIFDLSKTSTLYLTDSPIFQNISVQSAVEGGVFSFKNLNIYDTDGATY